MKSKNEIIHHLAIGEGMIAVCGQNIVTNLQAVTPENKYLPHTNLLNGKEVNCGVCMEKMGIRLHMKKLERDALLEQFGL